MTRHRPSLRLALLALTLGLAVSACGGGEDGSGETMPDLTLARLDADGELALDELGEPAVVNLWANWCVPCRAELPEFDTVASEVEGEVRFIGVNIGDPPDVALGLIEELDIGFEQVLDTSSDVSAELDVTSMPTTLFVDADGSIVERYSGRLMEADLRAILEERFGVVTG
ncbi:MAG: TlpA disulfide reductase family protein [Actinomycetota bacterium]|nr:TlpA disulfide reductase family protein [Actinomycetota bacterium]